MTYTQLALLGVAVAVTLDLAVLRTHLVRRRVFWTAYAIVIGFQLLTNGVLTVVLPKAPEAQPKQIQVKAS